MQKVAEIKYIPYFLPVVYNNSSKTYGQQQFTLSVVEDII